MFCNCNCSDNTTIKIIRETTASFLFVFNVSDLSSFAGLQFTIRKNYETAPIINENITGLSGNEIIVTLPPNKTALFTEFQNGKNSAQYIWGLDLLTNNGQIINIFPQTGNPAPLCIVYKHVPQEN